MKTAIFPTTLNLRQCLACAGLAAITTLGIFSVVATVAAPLLTGDRSAVASAHDVTCAPTARVLPDNDNLRDSVI